MPRPSTPVSTWCVPFSDAIDPDEGCKIASSLHNQATEHANGATEATESKYLIVSTSHHMWVWYILLFHSQEAAQCWLMCLSILHRKLRLCEHECLIAL